MKSADYNRVAYQLSLIKKFPGAWEAFTSDPVHKVTSFRDLLTMDAHVHVDEDGVLWYTCDGWANAWVDGEWVDSDEVL